LLENQLLDDAVSINPNSSLCFAEHFDITTLTEDFKQVAETNLLKAINLLDNHHSQNSMNAMLTKLQLLQCDYHEVNHRNTSTGNENLRISAAKHFAKIDKIRNQSLKEVAPELYEFYNRYGYSEEYDKFVPFPL
jgi:hypothetical protein